MKKIFEGTLTTTDCRRWSVWFEWVCESRRWAQLHLPLSDLTDMEAPYQDNGLLDTSQDR